MNDNIITIQATLEWHYYCPNPDCERSNHSRFQNETNSVIKITCPDCGFEYYVKLSNENYE